MIRFRIGQSWKRERAAPVDGFALELDGVDLLAGAGEEPLAQVVPDLVAAVHGLVVGGRTAAQLSLPEAHVEVALWREDGEADLAVVSLGRPARLVRTRVRVELGELAEATVRCGRALLADLGEAAPDALTPGARKKLVRALEQLEGAHPAEDGAVPRDDPWTHLHPAESAGTFGFALRDPRRRLLAFDRKGEAPLVSLLAPGEVSLRLDEAAAPWRQEAVPFLFAVELSRQASELWHAIELGDPSAKLELLPGTTLAVDLKGATARLGGRAAVAIDPVRLVRGAYELGIALAIAIAGRNKAQAKNPYLEELIARCREGLAHLRTPARATEGGAAVKKRARKTVADRPLEAPGRVKRLRFEPRWEKHHLGEEHRGALVLTPAGPVVSTPEAAYGFSPAGEVRLRHIGTRGVACARGGPVLVATEQRVVAYPAGTGEARWLRSHDGLAVGPDLEEAAGLWLAMSERRGVLAFDRVTGREVWRFLPPRTQRVFLSVQAHRALVATDSGELHGLELGDGQIRFRIRAPLPFLGPAVAWGRKLIATLGRGQTFAIFAADAHSGALEWEQELSLALPCAPRVLGSRVLIAGERAGDGVLVCFGAAGQPQWERALHLGHGPYALLQAGRSVLVTASNGASTLVAADGRVEWHLGAGGEPLACRIPPVSVRGVLLVPGEKVRAVDPRGGHVLGEIDAGPALCDLAADARLNVYLLDESGSLRAFKLATQLSVVPRG